jgi:hypothetical protein
MFNPIANNQNEFTASDGTTVFFSYKTPVAAFIPGKGVIKTSKKWSVTTSKHVNSWLKKFSPYVTITSVDQEVLDQYKVYIAI